MSVTLSFPSQVKAGTSISGGERELEVSVSSGDQVEVTVDNNLEFLLYPDFDFTQLDLLLFLEAQDDSTVTKTGDQVSTWLDTSGLSNDATGDSDGGVLKPIFSGIGNNAKIKFTGNALNEEFFNLDSHVANFNIHDGGSITMVAEIESASSQYSLGWSVGTYGIYIRIDDGSVTYTFNDSSSFSTFSPVYETPKNIGDTVVLTLTHNGIQEIKSRTDLETEDTADSSGFAKWWSLEGGTVDEFRIGQDPASGTYGLISFKQIICTTDYLTSEQITDLHTHLLGKYNR